MEVNMTKILLVEDDKSLREIYGVRLLAEGYQIASAGDGEEALAMAVKERPDLIISDVMMPKISGFDMLDILRSTPETKDVKVIMMTALSSEDQRARGESLGANRYLVKSQVGIEDVVRTVHDILADSPVAKAPAAQLFGAVVPTAINTASRPDAPRSISMPPARPVAPIQNANVSAPTAPSFQPQTFQPQPQPAPITAPEPVAVAPSMSPAPTPLQPIPAVQMQMPEPTAPFSTPSPTPLGTNSAAEVQPTTTFDIAAQIAKELGETPPTTPQL